MGKTQKKVGKGRLDKWYQLAKEQGYRARSAFKLIQLNKKYDFLSTARCVIDLCAAPGGWLQVAAKNMPPNSIIIGVDLVAIKPIPRCITLVEDITTDKCRRSLRAEVKDWKADVVLHDGAPNVGSAWVQDAFTQVELVLSSLRLATEFLTPGGTFVTKVFRSKDYNALLWVFNQLFSKVEATKPPSSRNVSAEIFVVCTGYLAPAKIDPKLLNAKFVFQDVDDAEAGEGKELLEKSLKVKVEGEKELKRSDLKMNKESLNVFHPEKKRKHRDGYEDGDFLLGKECGVMQFISSGDPIGVLGLVGRMKWETEEDKKLLKNPLTTTDIKACVQDLKILGKKDFKNLLKYRLAIREDLGLDVKIQHAEELTEEVVEVEPLDEEEQITEELERLAAEDAFRRRRERRRVNEKKNREVQRMQLNMVTPMDIGLERQDGVDDSDMFDLGEVEKKRGVKNRLGSDLDEDDEDDSEEEESETEEEEEYVSDDEEAKTRRLEDSLDVLYEKYQQHKIEKDAKHKAKEERRKRDAAEGGEWGGIGKEEEDSDSDIDDDPAPAPEDSSDEDSDAEVLEPEEEDEAMSNISDDEAADKTEVIPASSKRAQKAAAAKEAKAKAKEAKLITKLPSATKPPGDKSKQAKMWFDQPVFKGLPGLDQLLNGGDDEEEVEDEDEEEERGEEEEWSPMGEDEEMDEEEALKAFAEADEDDEESDDDFEGAVERHIEDSDMEEEADFKAQEEAEELKRQRIEDLGLTTAEAMTLAQQLVNRERTKTQLIDDGFNRHAFNFGGDGLPTWFLDDEQRHFRNNIPVTKEAVQALREKMRALNARPIKKIAEAKARKKMRTIRRIEKTRAKAQGINDDEDNGLTEKEKASSIAKVLAKSKSAAAKPVKKEIKLVVARGLNRGQKGRPKGVKGRYKMVDPRMKGEMRAMKRVAKRDKKGGGRRKKNH